jgi:DNA-binding LacI/PurR family transcriptional regulator
MSVRKRGRPSGFQSIYMKIVSDLERRLTSGEWPPGKPIPSCRQVAQMYRVGFNTALRAMKALQENGRVRMSARRTSVATLCASSSIVLQDAIAVVLKNDLQAALQSTYFRCLWKGIVHELATYGSTLVVLQDRMRWRTVFPAGLDDLRLRGVVLIGPFLPQMLRQYETLKLPVVLLDQPGKQYRIHTLSAANYKGGYEAARRLIDAGHKRLAFLRPIVPSIKDVDPDSRERQAGFVAACNKRLKSGEFRIFSPYRSVPVVAKEILSTKPAFTAVIAANPELAEQMAAAARAANVNIPRNLSIVTFRGRQRYSPDWSGPAVNFIKMGRLAIRMLFRNPEDISHPHLSFVWHKGTTFGPSSEL